MNIKEIKERFDNIGGFTEAHHLKKNLMDLCDIISKQQEQINRLIREKEPKRSMPHWPSE